MAKDKYPAISSTEVHDPIPEIFLQKLPDFTASLRATIDEIHSGKVNVDKIADPAHRKLAMDIKGAEWTAGDILTNRLKSCEYDMTMFIGAVQPRFEQFIGACNNAKGPDTGISSTTDQAKHQALGAQGTSGKGR